jgi:hypothetical protein
MRIRLYILCYHEESQKKANEEYGNYEWAKVLFIETTPYLENIMYSNWLLENKNDWKDFDYVGTISWSASEKIGKINMNQIITRLEREDPDIYAFWYYSCNMVLHANYWHPKFSSLWYRLLFYKKLSYFDILNSDIKAFFGNYWMCKPSWMEAYIEFFKDCKTILENQTDLQEDLWSDTGYKGKLSKEKLLEIYGKPYYPYHPFLLERLPCFFFWWKKAKLIY